MAGLYNCNTCRSGIGFGRYCNEDNPAPIPIWNIDDIEMNPCVCPLPSVKSWTFELIKLNRHFKNNNLPFSGGVLEQPRVFMNAMDIIDARFKKLEEED